MSWWRRKPSEPKVDYIAAVDEAGRIRDRVHAITREAEAAGHARDFRRLDALRDEQEAAHRRMQEIAREVGAHVATG